MASLDKHSMKPSQINLDSSLNPFTPEAIRMNRLQDTDNSRVESSPMNTSKVLRFQQKASVLAPYSRHRSSLRSNEVVQHKTSTKSMYDLQMQLNSLHTEYTESQRITIDMLAQKDMAISSLINENNKLQGEIRAIKHSAHDSYDLRALKKQIKDDRKMIRGLEKQLSKINIRNSSHYHDPCKCQKQYRLRYHERDRSGFDSPDTFSFDNRNRFRRDKKEYFSHDFTTPEHKNRGISEEKNFKSRHQKFINLKDENSNRELREERKDRRIDENNSDSEDDLLGKLNHQRTSLQTEINEFKTKKQKCCKALQDKVKIIKHDNLKFKNFLRELPTIFKEEHSEIQDKTNTIVKRIKEEKESLENENKKLKVSIEKTQAENLSLSVSNDRISEAIEILTDRLSELEKAHEEGQKEGLHSLKEEIGFKEKLLDKAQNTENKLKKEITILEKEIQICKEKENKYLEQIRNLETKNEKQSKQITQFTDEVNEKNTEISFLTGKVKEEMNKIDNYEKEVHRLQEREHKLLAEQLKTMEMLKKYKDNRVSDKDLLGTKEENHQLAQKLEASEHMVDKLNSDIAQLKESNRVKLMQKLESKNLIHRMSKSPNNSQEKLIDPSKKEELIAQARMAQRPSPEERLALSRNSKEDNRNEIRRHMKHSIDLP